MGLLSITIRILAVFAALALLASCTKRKFTGDDAVMVEYAKQIGLALNSYHQETAERPETLRAAEGFLAAGTAWPLNPCTTNQLRIPAARHLIQRHPWAWSTTRSFTVRTSR